VDFEHGLNAVVKRLREFLGDSADTPRFIETIPRRGYRFVMPIEPVAENGSVKAATTNETVDENPGRTPAAPSRLPWRPIGTAVATLAVLAVATWMIGVPRHADELPMRIVPLTTLDGWAGAPSFSPDGSQVAFSWSGAHDDNSDIYVTMIGGSDLRRLTTNAAVDDVPSWSPDGQHIAFIRRDPSGGGHLRVISPLGGADVKVSDFATASQASWSPDSRHIAVGHWSNTVGGDTSIYVLPTGGGQPHAITRATYPTEHVSPMFSPKGTRLAYAVCNLGCDVYVVPLDQRLAPAGSARRMTTHAAAGFIGGITWSRDGKFILYDSVQSAFVGRIWRLAADGSSAPERLELAGLRVYEPATAFARDRLAYAVCNFHTNLFAFDGRAPARSVVASSFGDFNQQYSPDGRRIAFASSRSAEGVELWISASDGAGAHQLTHGPGHWQGSPHWSPDGRQLVFDSQGLDGHWHIWAIDGDGGVPRQVTRDGGDQNVPTWSHDGQSLYFSWSPADGTVGTSGECQSPAVGRIASHAQATRFSGWSQPMVATSCI
jgi:Tol biopolymer transport system component